VTTRTEKPTQVDRNPTLRDGTATRTTNGVMLCVGSKRRQICLMARQATLAHAPLVPNNHLALRRCSPSLRMFVTRLGSNRSSRSCGAPHLSCFSLSQDVQSTRRSGVVFPLKDQAWKAMSLSSSAPVSPPRTPLSPEKKRSVERNKKIVALGRQQNWKEIDSKTGKKSCVCTRSKAKTSTMLTMRHPCHNCSGFDPLTQGIHSFRRW